MYKWITSVWIFSHIFFGEQEPTEQIEIREFYSSSSCALVMVNFDLRVLQEFNVRNPFQNLRKLFKYLRRSKETQTKLCMKNKQKGKIDSHLIYYRIPNPSIFLRQMMNDFSNQNNHSK